MADANPPPPGGAPPPPPPGGSPPPPPPGGAPPPPPPAGDKPWFDGLYGADGKINKDVWDKAPEAIKAHKDWFGKYETLEGLFGGAAAANKMAVAKAMTPLPPDATPQQIAERTAHLNLINNVPTAKEPAELVKAYGITKPDDLDAKFWRDDQVAGWAALAQKLSIGPSQFKELMNMQLQATRQEIAAAQTYESQYWTNQDNVFAQAMQKAGIDQDKAMNLATRGAATLGIDPKSNLFRDASVRAACVRFTNLVSEDRLIKGDAVEGAGANERQQALDVMNNPNNPMYKAWHESEHPQHEAAKDRVNELYRLFNERRKKAVPA